MKYKNLMQSAIMAALLCVVSPWVIPIGAVPMTLASFMIYAICAICDVKRSITAVSIYVLLGAIGLPIFAGFSGGVQVILGPTGGYIMGYLVAAVMIPILKDKIRLFITFCISTLAIYLCGIAWYMTIAEVNFAQAMAVCVLPFIVADVIKMILACICVQKIKTALKGKL